MTNTIEIIEGAGGSVRYGWSGWMGGVKGLRIADVLRLVNEGVLVATHETVTRRTKRSKGISSTVTTYTIAR